MELSATLIIISLSCLHIFSGPDHYLPFIALSKSRRWGLGKTILWTSLCGLGHIAGSVIISLVVIALGLGTAKVAWLQNFRGSITGWGLLLFGIGYTVWGLLQINKNKAHKHFEAYGDGNLYVYEHKHGQPVYPQQKHAVTPWVMFVIFALAPNEPIVPLLSILGINNSFLGVSFFVLVYVVATLFAMLAMVLLGLYGLSLFPHQWLGKYVHVVGGGTILLYGAGMVFMGW